MDFVLHDVLKIETQATPGYADLDRDFTAAILEEAGKIARDVLAPLNAVGDTQGCRLENGVVRTPDGFKAAFDTVREGGWMGLDCAEEFGGQGLPYVMNAATGEMQVASNMALNMYWGLTHGAYSAIHVHGSEEQKAKWLPKLVSGEWTGTMNLTEPHCGTDLGLLRTKAEPGDDGAYRITGQKIFISAGEHDMAENIIHLVLAKIPGGPDGVKGISLFIVPKFLVNEDGSLGDRNDLSCGKLEEKMGIHGNATCVMNYDGAEGYLVGEAHKGLRAMFTMMNEARVGVGLQGLGQAAAAYQVAADYARDRLQGRAIGEAANPDGPADPLIVHPDVRRALMDQKSFVEGGRAFALWAATLIDAGHRSDDKEALGLVSLLTPVVKGFLTDKGFDCTVQAQQMLGGHGYIEEWGVSQFVRDARIAMIYEGANGVQALDSGGPQARCRGRQAGHGVFRLGEDLHQGERRERGPEGRLPRSAEGGVEGPPGCGDVLHAERDEGSERGAGRVDGFPAPLRTCVPGVHVGADGQGRAGRVGGVPQGETRDRTLLHGAAASGDEDAPGADRERSGAGHGLGGGGFLSVTRGFVTRVSFSTSA